MKKYLSGLLFLLIVVGTSHAQVYKCKNDNGATEYSDRPCTNAQALRIDKKPDGAPATTGNPNERALRIMEADRRAKEPPPIECRFSSYTYGDSKGKVLAANAKQECLHNIELKAQGRDNEASMQNYQLWRDHHQMEQASRNASTQQQATTQLGQKIDDLRK